MLFGNKAVAEKLAFICFGYTSLNSNFFLRNGVWCARQIEIYSRFGVINRAWCSSDRGPNDCRRTFSSHTSGCRRCEKYGRRISRQENEGASSDPSIPEVKLTSRILFQLIASEIALQRGQPGAAYQTYLTLAEETGDPRIAERAAQIALAQMRRKSFEKLSPNGSNSHRITLRLRRPLSLAALFPINWIKSPAPQQPSWPNLKTKGPKLLSSRPSWL